MIGKSPFFSALPEKMSANEVEITARRIEAATRGATVESVLAPGMNVMKTFDPPLDALVGRTLRPVEAIRREVDGIGTLTNRISSSASPV